MLRSAGAGDDGAGAEQAFSHRSAGRPDSRRVSDLRRARCPARVARLPAVAGEREIAEAGEAHQRRGLGAQREAEAHDLGEAAGQQRGAGVVAQLAAHGDAAGDGQHVLHRATHLRADGIGGEIGPEGRRCRAPARDRGRGLHRPPARVTAVGSPRATSAAKVGPDSTAMAAARQRFRRPLPSSACRCPARCPWQQSTTGDAVAQMRDGSRGDVPQMLRRRHPENGIGLAQRRKIGGRADRSVERDIRQVDRVRVACR